MNNRTIEEVAKHAQWVLESLGQVCEVVVTQKHALTGYGLHLRRLGLPHVECVAGLPESVMWDESPGYHEALVETLVAAVERLKTLVSDEVHRARTDYDAHRRHSVWPEAA